MRSFRFPLWSIVLMVMVLVWVVIAIEKARAVSFQLATGSDSVPSGWWALPGLFATEAAVMCGIGLLAYALLYRLRKTGAQRLSDVEIVHRSK